MDEIATFFQVIAKMIEIVDFGGSLVYSGIPFIYVFYWVFIGYLPYYIAFCLLTAGFYYAIGKLKSKKK